MRFIGRIPIAFWAASSALAQNASELQQILDRLQRIEQQNQQLVSEVQTLRRELADFRSQPAASGATVADTQSAPLPERIEVQERRTEELAQSKVESEHRLPVQLTGMLLFNTFWNGKYAGTEMVPRVASLNPGPGGVGATFRQSILGLKFQGPSLFANGKVSGSVLMDFYGGSGDTLSQYVRLRIATIDLDWKRTTLSVAHDKPLISPREPDSLAKVGVSPLTAAGNLWFWQPQIRGEHRFLLGDSAGLRLQAAMYMTNESTTGVPEYLLDTVPSMRPAFQSRVEFWKEGAGRRLEIASGIHVSNSRIGGVSVPSRAYSVDWLIRPWANLDFTGTFFTGKNTSVMGALRPGITFYSDGRMQPVSGMGGWGQLTWRATPRMSFNIYGGQQSNESADLLSGAPKRNLSYAANVMYKLTSNVVTSFEATQIRTTYIGSGTRIVPHYDLALAYLF